MTETYPESRFGQPPATTEIGVHYGYSSRAVSDMEASDEAAPRVGFRSPAGLEVGNAPRSPVGPADAEAARGTPRTPAPEFNPAGAPSAPAGLDSITARKGVQEVALIAGDLGYFPKTVFVTRDVPVRMYVTGASKNTLCIMMDSFQVRKQVRSQKIEEITFTPNLPGKYRFYCPVNGMEGTLIVKELTTTIPAN